MARDRFGRQRFSPTVSQTTLRTSRCTARIVSGTGNRHPIPADRVPAVVMIG